MKGVIYARYSSDNQREESIIGQIRENKAYAEKNGIEIIDTYIDRALSAKTDNRPEFQRMIRESAKKNYDVVIVWKLDRFARNRYDSAKYKAILKRNNIKVVSATEAISEGAEGIILESVLEGMAEYYSAELAEKVSRGMTENALKCKYNGGGSVPFGYRINEEHHYEAVDEYVPLVQDIFEWYSRGDSIKSILSRLNDLGVKTSKGYPFSYSGVHSMLRNRLYIGEYTYGNIAIPGGAPRIVSDELFEAAAKRVEANRKRPAAEKAKVKYILSSKLFCGYCMSSMVGESCNKASGTIYRYYKCRSTKKSRECHKKPVRKEWLEDLVVDKIMKVLLNRKLLNELIDEQIALLTQKDDTLPSLRKELEDTRKRIKNIMETIEAGIASKTVVSRLTELEAQESKITNSIEEKESRIATIDKEEILDIIHSFVNMDMSLENNRQWLIDTFVKCIILYDDKIVISTVATKNDIEIPTKETAEQAAASSDSLDLAPPTTKGHPLGVLL